MNKVGIPHEMRPDMAVTDLAYAILKKGGKPMHFKDLISAVMEVKAMVQSNSGRLIAQMHTEINLDSRFIHLGGGEWGLREWQKGKVVRMRGDGTGRSGEFDEDDEIFDEEEVEEELEELDDETFEEDEFEEEKDPEDE
jgi:DNA-directed RNA polymerase subunit delta